MATYTPFQIKSFKYDGSLHRTWVENWRIPSEQLVKRQKEEGWVVLINDHTQIIEAGGNEWISRVPGVVFFLPNVWYNIVALIESEGIRYYCNLASPYYLSGDTITYIDYDLDVIVRPDKQVVLVDEEEYRLHKAMYRYPQIVEDHVEQALKHLQTRIDHKDEPFEDEIILRYFQQWRQSRSPN